MARLLYNNEWFEEIASRGYFESDFETILRREAADLFAGYYFIPFKMTVYSDLDLDARQPDFALIHHTYASWWVVEVELGHHSLNGHVLPQVRTLSRATYSHDEANYLCSRDSRLDKSQIVEMFKGSSPRVLVIVNVPVKGWVEQLRGFGAKVIICQVFRSRRNDYVLRLNGEYPKDRSEVSTTCECSPVIHRYLEIHSPTQLQLAPNGKLLLYYQGRASEWQRVDTAGQVYLHALRDHDLKPGVRYEIVRQREGVYEIQQQSKSRSSKGVET